MGECSDLANSANQKVEHVHILLGGGTGKQLFSEKGLHLGRNRWALVHDSQCDRVLRCLRWFGRPRTQNRAPGFRCAVLRDGLRDSDLHGIGRTLEEGHQNVMNAWLRTIVALANGPQYAHDLYHDLVRRSAGLEPIAQFFRGR